MKKTLRRLLLGVPLLVVLGGAFAVPPAVQGSKMTCIRCKYDPDRVCCCMCAGYYCECCEVTP